jgi:UDP-2,4-diacetamido-2,4,6-trideoxy-beta-L-altropyranose hydrolase
MGTGHVMRCLALALAARQAGMETLLIGNFGVPWLRRRLNEEKIPHRCLAPEKNGQTERPQEFLAQIKGFSPDCVVLDGYHFGLNWQTATMQAGFKLLLIDDYGHLPEYQCNLLLNQNFGADAIEYRGEIDLLLTGPHYSLLRPEFAQAHQRAKDRVFEGKVKRLLINLGGGDFSHFLPALTDTIMSALTGKIAIRALAGSMPDQAIYKAFAGISGHLEILRNVSDMPSLFLDTELCISAAGSTCWELCCLGVPFITLTIAENQEHAARQLSDAGVAPNLTVETLKSFLNDPQARAEFSHAGMTLVDGMGAQRVLSCFNKMLCKNS